jgi:hypothetical protein
LATKKRSGWSLLVFRRRWTQQKGTSKEEQLFNLYMYIFSKTSRHANERQKKVPHVQHFSHVRETTLGNGQNVRLLVTRTSPRLLRLPLHLSYDSLRRGQP